jgi:hypothetical protein
MKCAQQQIKQYLDSISYDVNVMHEFTNGCSSQYKYAENNLIVFHSFQHSGSLICEIWYTIWREDLTQCGI